MTKNSKDFRDWDIEPETSFEGVDENGFPFYLWRESADNRLTLARPRYCCITPRDGELFFTFFNPSEDVRGSGGWTVFFCVASMVAVAVVGNAWYNPPPPRPYHLDESLPPFLILAGAALSASVVGAIVGGLWHVSITLFCWMRGRFPGEGRLHSMPLQSLMGFGQAQAGELGAMVNGEKAKTGHGLTAVFDDGSMIILTGNAWDYRSIVEKHQDLTNLFRTPRDNLLKAWAASKKSSESSTYSVPAASSPGVPDAL